MFDSKILFAQFFFNPIHGCTFYVIGVVGMQVGKGSTYAESETHALCQRTAYNLYKVRIIRPLCARQVKLCNR